MVYMSQKMIDTSEKGPTFSGGVAPRQSAAPLRPESRMPPVAVSASPAVLTATPAGDGLPRLPLGASLERCDTHADLDSEPAIVTVKDFMLFYARSKALHGVNMKIPMGKVTALVGPSGCGKSTLLRSMNRLNDLIDGVRVEGNMYYRGQAIYGGGIDVIGLRKRMGMVFQKSNPFPMSIYANVVYGLRIAGERSRAVLDEVCERSLRGAALWDEVKDRLHSSAFGLSGGQQQRLCIARAIAPDPEVLLMDEPCSALDPIATAKVEELVFQLRGKYTVVIVTHNMQQAARVSDYTAFMYLGRLIEYGPTNAIFFQPHRKETEAYVTGRFG